MSDKNFYGPELIERHAGHHWDTYITAKQTIETAQEIATLRAEVERKSEADVVLMEENQSLKEKLKIAVSIVKHYEPELDIGKFMHDIGTCDFLEYNQDQRLRAETAEAGVLRLREILAEVAKIEQSTCYDTGNGLAETFTLRSAIRQCADICRNALANGTGQGELT